MSSTQSMVDPVVAALRQWRGSYPEIARRSGLHYMTVVRIASGKGNPTLQTIRRIESAMQSRGGA